MNTAEPAHARDGAHTEGATTLCIEGPPAQPLAQEFDILSQLLQLEGARVLELGCGAAEKTRQIARQGGVDHIVAAEVDVVQHAKNLASEGLEHVTFRSYGAEAIDEPDESFDVVLMFKSLHHVPVAAMPAALAEIRRVLKPGGLAYLSEPVFAGAFNEIIRLFHDEFRVRRAAFDAIVGAVQAGVLELVTQRFFRNPIRFDDFAQFERGVLNVTHTDFALTPAVLDLVRARFEQHRTALGYPFEIPNRVDLLRRPAP